MHQRVTVLRPQLTFVRDAAGQPPRRSLSASTVPGGLVSPACLRMVRPGGVAARAAAPRNAEGDTCHATLGENFGASEVRAALKFAFVRAPDGTRFASARRAAIQVEASDPVPPGDLRSPLPAMSSGPAGIKAGIIASPSELSLDDVAALATAEIRPLRSARDRIEARIPALSSFLAAASDDELPSRVAVGPVIDEALVWSLVERSPELLLPGVQQFPDNAVRIVEANPEFIASFLAGANHEMASELLWREYPADMAATTFRRFWDRPDLSADIDPMIEWTPSQQLAEIGAAGGESVVVLIRGDLVRHYPTVHVLLRDPAGADVRPSFGGWIPRDVRFIAFDVPDPDAVTDPASDWQVVIQEQATEPRFGLDTAPPGAQPGLKSWNDLCWDHLTGHEESKHLAIGTGGFPSRETPPKDATWGLNSANMARITYQAPFRMVIPVKDLIGTGGGAGPLPWILSRLEPIEALAGGVP